MNRVLLFILIMISIFFLCRTFYLIGYESGFDDGIQEFNNQEEIKINPLIKSTVQ